MRRMVGRRLVRSAGVLFLSAVLLAVGGQGPAQTPNREAVAPAAVAGQAPAAPAPPAAEAPSQSAAPFAGLAERAHSPLLPRAWRGLAADTNDWARKVAAHLGQWHASAAARADELALVLLGTLTAFLALRMLAARLVAGRRARAPEAVPFVRRARVALFVLALRAGSTVGAATLLYAGLESLGLLAAPWDRVGAALHAAVVQVALLGGLVAVVLAPRAPRWRLVAVPDAAAPRLAQALLALVIAFAATRAVESLGPDFAPGASLALAASLGASLATALVFMAALLVPLAGPLAQGGEPASRQAPRWLKLPLWGVALAIVVAGTLGYVALARFLALQVVPTGAVVAVGWLLQRLIHAMTREPRAEGVPVTEMLETRFGIAGVRRDQIARLIEAVLSLALAIATIPVLMLSWGVSGGQIRAGFQALLFGVQVGSFQISLARIVIGAAIFTAALFATRLVQHWLRDKVLKDTRLDSGAVDSIDKVVGYVGIAAGAVLAISYAGLDITNLAIVAGALSVGIGFGLQSIVNNFVSGLILLIERPIKVGDRIVVGTEQGFVRRISVRATEVETFDKASLIVPNSELVTGRVLNWTHRDRMGVCNVKVGAAYTCDPDQVLAILKGIAAAHPDVLAEPAPSAALEAFGDSALQFGLRVSVADLDKAAGVQSELRVAILKAFRAAGVEIPFHQVDVTLRDLEAVKRYLARAMEEKAAGRPGGIGAPDAVSS